MPTISFECGKTTCTSPTTRNFCKFMTTSYFGTRFHCSLFNDVELKDEKYILSGFGWLQRLPECLKLDENKE